MAKPGMTYEEAREASEADFRTLGRQALRQAKRRPLKTAIEDSGGKLSWLKLSVVAVALAPNLELAGDEERVGILLPAGRAGALANLAVALTGRTAVNLNHTLGQEPLTRMCAIAQLRTVITARAYLERIGPLEIPGRVLLAEDLIANLSRARLLGAALGVLFRKPERYARGKSTDVAAVVFSSGSVGEPKGVQLTHQQVLANCDGIMAHLDLRPGVDILLTPLPLFHVFGLVPGLWLPLTNGFGIAGQADPRDGQALGVLAGKTKPTFLISAPTFVRGYMRRVSRDQFATLRFAVVGAEACPVELMEAFEQRYGMPLYEGYGTTELSPVVAVNSPEKHRVGSVGTALPGVEVFTVDSRTEEVLPEGERGLLVVRSPARMLGYLGEEELTEKVFVHGGYNTGDIGWVDDDGFIYLTGRLARFAKIGGEMVPLDNIESALQRELDERHEGEGAVAVTAIPDAARGERIVLLHEPLPCPVEELLVALEAFPPLFRPKPADVYEVRELPVLGSGKSDVAGLRELARAMGKERGTAQVSNGQHSEAS